jgi:ATP-dependent Clp protease adapter protein ClpS
MAEVLEMPEIDVGSSVDEHEEAAIEFGWNVVLWNDDITPFPVVIALLMQVVQLSEDQAVKAAWHIHNHGKGIIATADRPKAESIKVNLEKYQLTVTLEKVEV